MKQNGEIWMPSRPFQKVVTASCFHLRATRWRGTDQWGIQSLNPDFYPLLFWQPKNLAGRQILRITNLTTVSNAVCPAVHTTSSMFKKNDEGWAISQDKICIVYFWLAPESVDTLEKWYLITRRYRINQHNYYDLSQSRHYGKASDINSSSCLDLLNLSCNLRLWCGVRLIKHQWNVMATFTPSNPLWPHLSTGSLTSTMLLSVCLSVMTTCSSGMKKAAHDQPKSSMAPLRKICTASEAECLS